MNWGCLLEETHLPSVLIHAGAPPPHARVYTPQLPSYLLFFFQENVSCLNTSLVILMLARRKEKLPFYLRTLQQMEYTEKYPGFILNNFHSLLRFWQQHYLNKDKDSTCLENVREPHRSGSGPQQWLAAALGRERRQRALPPSITSCSALHTILPSQVPPAGRSSGIPCEQDLCSWLWHSDVPALSGLERQGRCGDQPCMELVRLGH